MAKQGLQNTSINQPQGFSKGLYKDMEDSMLSPGAWVHARNAVNNSQAGDLGVLGNEPSNFLCGETEMTIIGAIHLFGDKWFITSTDDTYSEVGIFDESSCSYDRIFKDTCPGFKKTNLIKGIAREKEDCTWQVYWADGLNHDYTLNLGNPSDWPYTGQWKSVPWNQTCTTDSAGCVTCVNQTTVDCDKMRLARLAKQPCITVSKGPSGGTLRNGSYYAIAAYTIKGIRVTDYSVPSNIVSLFEHDNVAGAIDINVYDIDQDNFEEFELVVVGTVNQQTFAKKIGIYSTRQTTISLDQIKESLTSVPIEQIPIRNPLFDKSDAIYENGEYALRVGPSSAFDFNYQPLANRIQTNWVCVRYPADYYQKGGTNTGHMRDEVYPYFIRWVRDTGARTSSYHIPGRWATGTEKNQTITNVIATDYDNGNPPERWEVENTATITSTPGTVLSDGGVVVAKGQMGYWESTEKYPDDKPEIWNASAHTWSSTGNTNHDLCGKNIRHHRFPDNYTSGSHVTNHYISGGQFIQIMGVEFSNITPPRDNNGNLIPGIVGYEILRGSREGNKTVIAKGLLNNMGSYTIEGDSSRTGLYANYPYNDLGLDKFLCKTHPDKPDDITEGNMMGGDLYKHDHFTFHSPDTQFTHPFLAAKEVKIYNNAYGSVLGQFTYPNKHPQHKLITDTTFFIGLLGGLSIALASLMGKRTYDFEYPRVDMSAGGAGLADGGVSVAAAAAAVTAAEATSIPADAAWNNGANIGFMLAGTPKGDLETLYLSTWLAGRLIPNLSGGTKTVTKGEGLLDNLPYVLRVANAIPLFTAYLSEGTDSVLRLLKAIIPFRQYALQYKSHGHYNNVANPPSLSRREIGDSIYLSPNVHEFGTSYRINNQFRNRSVALSTVGTFNPPVQTDTSRRTVGQMVSAGVLDWDYVTMPFRSTQASSHYVALKQRLRNQYGQLDSIQQIPSTTCVIDKSNSTSPVVFGGDTYVTRYTEKNTFFYFYDWLFNQPDGFEYNYRLRKMIPHPSYYADFTEFDANDFISGSISNISTWLSNLIGSGSSGIDPNDWKPSDRHCLDKDSGLLASGVIALKKAYFYLFNSGVRDFFVESEINTDFRDWGETIQERHYDPYRFTDLNAIFDANPDVIKGSEYFKYDISLSVSRIFNNFISWGNIQPRYYDPQVAESCYSYYPERVLYSLPQNQELAKDNWYMYLPNNYKDFKSRITCIKPVGKNGAVIFFENESPVQFQGIDQLQTDGGVKLTIGDGGLFKQPLQNVYNADKAYEYGSCQSRLSVINTPVGLFWISQNQGKIFSLGQGEISAKGIKYWLAEYLPYQILKDFPTFELLDNPVIGVGCQAIYDNEDGTVYFTKRDFKLRTDITDTVTYVGEDNFLVNGILPIKLGHTSYFEDSSWTLSYDPVGIDGKGAWVSFHDWHPNLLLPSKTHFMSIKNNGIWKHNDVCDSYCNFYGTEYPFEVEFAVSSGQNVSTVRGLEYYLESYVYQGNCIDKFHVLDHNFDHAIISNSEQVSGLLRLNPTPKNNAPAILQYPAVGTSLIDILYSKEENKYRFNQFWDVTDDRGEFTGVQRPIWISESNGYIKDLNPNNLNYNKPPHQRKRFRHYLDLVFLRKRISGNVKMFVKMVSTKKLYSSR